MIANLATSSFSKVLLPNFYKRFCKLSIFCSNSFNLDYNFWISWVPSFCIPELVWVFLATYCFSSTKEFIYSWNSSWFFYSLKMMFIITYRLSFIFCINLKENKQMRARSTMNISGSIIFLIFFIPTPAWLFWWLFERCDYRRSSY